MNSSLLELCNLIADKGVKYAHQYKQLFLEVVAETAHKAISDKQVDTIFKIFSFLNWAYANGVWSNLSNTTLRRDLMGQSMKSIVLKTAYELAEDKSNEGVAFLHQGWIKNSGNLPLCTMKGLKNYRERGTSRMPIPQRFVDWNGFRNISMTR